MVAEVNNTFGDRQPYVLSIEAATSRTTARTAHEHPAGRDKKVMHVSPFFSARWVYRWDFDVPAERVARVTSRCAGNRSSLRARGRRPR